MASKFLKAVSPAAMALSDGGIKGVMRNFSPAYNLAKGKDEENDSYLNKAMKQGAAGKAAGMKKGGKVKSKVKKMRAGGPVGNGKKKADGIALRGKTRCKMR